MPGFVKSGKKVEVFGGTKNEARENGWEFWVSKKTKRNFNLARSLASDLWKTLSQLSEWQAISKSHRDAGSKRRKVTETE